MCAASSTRSLPSKKSSARSHLAAISTMTLLEIFDPKPAARPVGIDLGTTNSLVARVRDDKPQVSADCNGARLLPSAGHHHARGRVIVGAPALRLGAGHARATSRGGKWFMAR